MPCGQLASSLDNGGRVAGSGRRQVGLQGQHEQGGDGIIREGRGEEEGGLIDEYESVGYGGNGRGRGGGNTGKT